MTLRQSEYQALERRIEKLVEKWRMRLGLGYWKIDRDYVYGEAPADESSLIEGFQGLARTRATFAYQTAQMTFWLDGWDGIAEAEFEGHVVHELVHILLDAIKPDLANPELWQLNEYTTEMVARAFLR